MHGDDPYCNAILSSQLLACLRAGRRGAMLDVVPSQTLYASNLNGKTKKQGEQPPLLRRRLDAATTRAQSSNARYTSASPPLAACWTSCA